MSHDLDCSGFRRALGQSEDSESVNKKIEKLRLRKHSEGGFFAETDRDTRKVPNPFADRDAIDLERDASTIIYYLLTPSTSYGTFHRNKGRTVHTHHRGRGQYVIVHADEASPVAGAAWIETFVVGPDLEKGERLQWIVDGGKYKASFLLPDAGSDRSEEGLLINETVVPGFEFADHDFMKAGDYEGLVSEEYRNELRWLVRKAES